MDPVPRRIVCLTAETAELLYQIGAADRVVGVSCFAPPPPDGLKRPVVSVFTTFRYDVIASLKPDLVLAFSDLQLEAVQELGRRGFPVYLTNQRTIDQTLDTMALLGRLVGCERAATALLEPLRARLEAARREAEQSAHRPSIYFEEWDDPMITGIRWASELIHAAGGRDAFAELSDRPTAGQRIIEPEAVIERRPDIIIASWCGKRARLDHICARPGWGVIPAVRDGAVHEVPAAQCLRPGLGLITEALPRFGAIVRRWQASRARSMPSP